MIVNVSNFLESAFEHMFELQYLLPDDLTLKAPNDGRLVVAMAAGLVILIVLGLVRHMLYLSRLPSYDEIPSTILHHLASKQALRELDGRIDVAIIGSGIGALTTASILSRFGYKVAVFEQHTTIGGSTHMYKTAGYDFDVGVHYVGGRLDHWSSVFRILYNYLSDGKLEWNRIAETFDVAYNSTTKERIEFTGDRDANRKTLLAHFPDLDTKALDLYYEKCRKARNVAYISWALKCLPPTLTRWVWNLGYGKLYQRHCMGTTLQVMRDECGLPEDVIGAITYSYGDYGTTPKESPFFIQAFMDNHYDDGAFFPKGKIQLHLLEKFVSCRFS